MIKLRKVSKEVRFSETLSDELYDEMYDKWQEAKKEGMTEKQYIQLLESITDKDSKRSNGTNKLKSKRYTSWRLFNAIWTAVLVIAVFFGGIAYSEMFRNIIQHHLHHHLYSINRITRLAFVAVHPYLLAGGLDLTRICLMSNPLVNSSMSCPCINYPSPVELDHQTFNMIPNPLPVHLVRQALPITRDYGIATIIEYVTNYGHVPSSCLQASLGKNGPKSIEDFTNDNMVEMLMENGQWGFMWHDCNDTNDVIFKTLLPKINTQIKENKIGVYTLISQWEKSFPHDLVFQDTLVCVVVLKGSIRVKIEPSHHCHQYCEVTHDNLHQGDIMVYDKRYWTYIAHSWSNISFIMATSISTNN